MKVFYLLMALLVAGTLVPSALFLVLHLFTGDAVALRRARKLWNLSRVFALVAVNLLIWGGVATAVWSLIA